MLIISMVIGLLGLLIGSSLNVVIFRVSRRQFSITPGPYWPACEHALRTWDLIPVISFLIRKRQCRNCQIRLSWRYPAVEILTGILFFLVATINLGTETHPVRLLLNLVFVAVLVALAFIDLDTLRLPDVLTLPLLGLGLLGAVLIPGNPSGWESAFSALGAGCCFWIIARVYPQGMGLGDVKLVAAMGAFLGFPAIFLAIFMASIVGALVEIFLLLVGRKRFGQQIPFGPYLAMGAILSLLGGTWILDWYWG